MTVFMSHVKMRVLMSGLAFIEYSVRTLLGISRHRCVFCVDSVT